jgi:hypothetical protein
MLDEDILRLYEKHWSQYKAMCTQLDDCCTFINLHWVRHEHNCGRRCVSDIATVGYLYFIYFDITLPILVISKHMGKSFYQTRT